MPDCMQQDAITDESRRYYVRAKTLARLLDLHPSTLWRWVADGRLPQPHRLGAGVTAWRWSEVEAALQRASQS